MKHPSRLLRTVRRMLKSITRYDPQRLKFRACRSSRDLRKTLRRQESTTLLPSSISLLLLNTSRSKHRIIRNTRIRNSNSSISRHPLICKVRRNRSDPPHSQDHSGLFHHQRRIIVDPLQRPIPSIPTHKATRLLPKGPHLHRCSKPHPEVSRSRLSVHPHRL